MVCNIARRTVDNIAVYRCRASFDDFKKDVKQQVATECLWASLQAHRVVAEYTTHEFRHHPSIALNIKYHLQLATCTIIECRGQ